jgi:hypothetical protein
MNKKFLQSVAIGITGLSLIASCSHFDTKKESNICGAKNGCAAAKAEEAHNCAAKKDEAHKCAGKKDEAHKSAAKKDKKAKKAKKAESAKATEEKKTN